MIKKIKDNKVLKVFTTIIKIAVFLILFVYVGFIAVQKVLNRDILGYRIYTVSSDSMNPTYKRGDVILVEKTEKEDLKVGDVITYLGEKQELRGLTITHRITSLKSLENGVIEIITKGDNNIATDPSITDKQVLGVVTYKFKIYSAISLALNNKFFFFFLVFVPLVLVLFLEGADFFISLAKKGEE